jgi:hypothetical protein
MPAFMLDRSNSESLRRLVEGVLHNSPLPLPNQGGEGILSEDACLITSAFSF